jgi:hydroxyethylthiazole kinase-like uncharacterized protein yjeF
MRHSKMEDTLLPSLPPRPKNGNKGTFGRILVIGGSEEMIGAPALAGTAALRMGAGLVQIAVPKSILSSVLSITPELIGFALSSSASTRLISACERADAILIGPGMGQSTEARNRVLQIVRLKKPMVVDADALNILSQQVGWPAFFKADAVLTPHPGEMSRLIKLIGKKRMPTNEKGRLAIAVNASRAFKQVIVLKGNHTIVTDGTHTYVNHTGDSSLAKAGTGDVLSGMIVTLLAQQMIPFEAACLAVYLHGKAGELAGKKIGKRSTLAHEVVDRISEVILTFEAESRKLKK